MWEAPRAPATLACSGPQMAPLEGDPKETHGFPQHQAPGRRPAPCFPSASLTSELSQGEKAWGAECGRRKQRSWEDHCPASLGSRWSRRLFPAGTLQRPLQTAHWFTGWGRARAFLRLFQNGSQDRGVRAGKRSQKRSAWAAMVLQPPSLLTPVQSAPRQLEFKKKLRWPKGRSS